MVLWFVLVNMTFKDVKTGKFSAPGQVLILFKALYF
jgi:hypothetical protein